MELPSSRVRATHQQPDGLGLSRKSVFGGVGLMRKQAVDDALLAMGLHGQRYTLVGGSLTHLCCSLLSFVLARRLALSICT